MIPDEIIRRRIPPTFTYKIPHSELIDQQDPNSIDPDIYSVNGANAMRGKKDGTDVDTISSQRMEGEKALSKLRNATADVFPGSYARLIASDQTAIADDIRKYVSSNYVNPVGNSSYMEYRRRLARFSHSF